MLDKHTEKNWHKDSLTFLTTGQPSERTVRSFAATPWSMLLACSPRSPELLMNVPSAKTTAARTCKHTRCYRHLWLWQCFLVPAERLAQKSISKMTYFVSSGTLNLNSIKNQSIRTMLCWLQTWCTLDSFVDFGTVLYRLNTTRIVCVLLALNCFSIIFQHSVHDLNIIHHNTDTGFWDKLFSKVKQWTEKSQLYIYTSIYKILTRKVCIISTAMINKIQHHTSGISSVNSGYNFSCARSRTPRHRAAS